MTTIHAYTATQKTVDGPSGKVGGDGAFKKLYLLKSVQTKIPYFDIVQYIVTNCMYVCLMIFFFCGYRNGVMVVVPVRTSFQPPLEQPRPWARSSQYSMGKPLSSISNYTRFMLFRCVLLYKLLCTYDNYG